MTCPRERVTLRAHARRARQREVRGVATNTLKADLKSIMKLLETIKSLWEWRMNIIRNHPFLAAWSAFLKG